MAAEEPPVIISNGGVAEELAKDLAPADPRDRRLAYQIIMDNIRELNKRCQDTTDPLRPVGRKINPAKKPARSTRVYWRLANEAWHPDEVADVD